MIISREMQYSMQNQDFYFVTNRVPQRTGISRGSI